MRHTNKVPRVLPIAHCESTLKRIVVRGHVSINIVRFGIKNGSTQSKPSPMSYTELYLFLLLTFYLYQSMYVVSINVLYIIKWGENVMLCKL